ncbi:helix-turn-helix domain-containing protein (plasmid) [Streptomyces sp. BI20]|uniref:helix-turn-helix domain-containing protein n=1 Tax=Streptomyces sp. BI20 TaxID=3403460 RepID=UPI003C76E9DF
MAETVPEYVWSANNALVFTPMGMYATAYPLLVHLLGRQEPGGRIALTQEELARTLGVARSNISRGLQHLAFARMVFKEGNRAYRLSPLIAGFRTPAEQLQAIAAMDECDRFDLPDFQARYEHEVALHEADKRARRHVAPTIDLASRRRR